MELNEVVQRKCQKELEDWGVELSQVSLEREFGKWSIVLTFGVDNVVDMTFEDQEEKEQMMVYLRSVGVREHIVD